MTDAWKGEHLISAKPTPEQRVSISQQQVQAMAHRKRAAKGTNQSRSGGPWARSIHAWAMQGKAERL